MKFKVIKPSLFKAFLMLAFVTFISSVKAQNSMHFDPSFPVFVEDENNLDMQKYAKMYPPVPLENQFSTTEQYQSKLESWLRITPYYPQFIPYHLYKGGLTSEDDIMFFEKAKIAWAVAHF